MQPRDLPRTALRRRKTPFRVSKPSFGLLLGIASTVLIVCLAVLLSGQLLLSVDLPQLCAAVRCCLLRRYIFFAVNFMVLLLVLLKLADREYSGEEVITAAGGARELVSPDEWFDALSSPTPFGDVITGKGASPLEVPLSDAIAEVGKSGLLVSFLAPFPDFTTTKASESRSTPASFLEPADSSTGGSGSDEFYSCPPTPSSSPVSTTSPVPAVAVATVKPSPPAVEAEDSMGATWKVICRRVTAALHLKTAARGRPWKLSERFQEVAGDSMDATWKAITGVATAAPRFSKSSTWDAPPSVEAVVLSAARAQLRKSETLQLEAAAAAGARRAVLEKRMRGREVAIVEDCDEMMNRRFDTFIQNFNEQLRLQRMASLRRRRYMDMHEHPLLCN